MTGALQATSGGATQTTQIEQARAVADVLAAMEAAKRWPREEEARRGKMETACQRRLVAERAFWSFPRGGNTLTGPTIDLARTIGAIWSNFQWGVSELSRDDDAGVSQMIAWAWDLETNTRNSTAWLVPHYRDVKDKSTNRNKRVKLEEMRDVYENNANQGARRVRQMILDLLPDWYVEEAIETCRGVFEQRNRPVETIRKEVGEELKPLGVTMPRVLARVGREEWADTTRGDLATLRIIARTIQRGEGTARELFPEPVVRETVTVRELAEPDADARPLSEHVTPVAEATEGAGSTQESEDVPTEEVRVERGRPIEARQRSRLGAIFTKTLGFTKDPKSVEDRHLLTSQIVDRRITTWNDLTWDEAELVIATTRGVQTPEQAEAFVTDWLNAAVLRFETDEAETDEGASHDE